MMFAKIKPATKDIKIKKDDGETKIKMETDDKKVKIKTDDEGNTKIKETDMTDDN